jgi:ACS family allantoate permease-like MFS transporter
MDPEKHSFDPEGNKKIPEPLADAFRNGSLDKKILEHSDDEGQVIEIDAATNKRLLRKIDWNLMPVHATRKLFYVHY